MEWPEKQQRFKSEIKKNFFHQKDSQALEQVTQKDFAVPTPGGFQGSAGRNPLQSDQPHR